MAHQPLHVDFSIKLSDLVRAMNGRLAGIEKSSITGVALDTRALVRGDVFFALEAMRDGHEFVPSAIEHGASAVVVRREQKGEGPFVYVDNTLEALGGLARHVRRGWGGPVVAISGSNGKTTTKEMTAAVVGADRKTHKTPGTWNNQLGVPLTLLLLTPLHRAAVLELGISEFGEMEKLASVAEPNIAILTNIGPVHLEKLGSAEGVAKAKGELFAALDQNGTAVINVDDTRIKELSARVRSKKITVSVNGNADVTARVVEDLGSKGLRLEVKYGDDRVEILTPFLGLHNVSNLLCAFAAALSLGVPASRLQAGVDAIERPEMRLENKTLPNGARVIMDCYNANPVSTKVALDVTRKIAKGRAIAVLGDMLELGEASSRAHLEIGIAAAQLHYDLLFVMGRFAGDVAQGAIQGGIAREKVQKFGSHEEMAEAVAKEIEREDTIVVKGSRGMKLEQFWQALEARMKKGQA